MYSKPKGVIFLFELVVHGIGVQEYRTSRLLVLAYYDNPKTNSQPTRLSQSKKNKLSYSDEDIPI